MILGNRLTTNILWLTNKKTALPASGFFRTETVEHGL